MQYMGIIDMNGLDSFTVADPKEDVMRLWQDENTDSKVNDSTVQKLNMLSLRIPATPSIYDLIWNYEGASLWFFTNLKGANEDLETLFLKSFHLNLIRLFPYTSADITAGLSNKEKDRLYKLSPTVFVS